MLKPRVECGHVAHSRQPELRRRFLRMSAKISTSARTTLTGVNSMPSLGASAAANFYVDYSNFETDLYDATAYAFGYQTYMFVGATEETYTIGYHVDGMITGGDPTGKNPNPNTIDGAVYVYESVFDDTSEINPILASNGFSFAGDGSATAIGLPKMPTYDDAFFRRGRHEPSDPTLRSPALRAGTEHLIDVGRGITRLGYAKIPEEDVMAGC